ncbi:MAG: 6-phosphogluconolactonase [Flavobacteriia bacterium]|jgi:6-phosphogluconolactonase
MEIKSFSTATELEQSLSKKITQDLTQALELQNEAFLLVSGGSTPIKLFQVLSLQDIHWEKVTIGLVDERFVPNNNEFSNELLVKTHLLQNFASKATFIGMVQNSENELSNLEICNKTYAPFCKNKVTVSILGMGEDGHTASLFPNDPDSEKDLSGNESAQIISTLAPNFPNKRISCNKNLLINSYNIYLMLVGESKIEVLNKAKSENYPIAKFLDATQLEIYFSATK